jgi:hypothetical protein
VAIPLVYLCYTAYLKDFSIRRSAGAVLVAVWFAMSVYDAASGHRLLDGLYPDSVEPDEVRCSAFNGQSNSLFSRGAGGLLNGQKADFAQSA